MPTKTFTSIFEGKQDKLEDMIDIEHGLLRKLEAFKVITSHHRIAIEVTLVMLLLACFITRSHRTDIEVNLVAVGMIVLNTVLFCEIEL